MASANSPFRANPGNPGQPPDRNALSELQRRGSPIQLRPRAANAGRSRARYNKLTRRDAVDWRTVADLFVKVSGLRQSTSTYDLYKTFEAQGTITRIDIFEDHGGIRSNAKLVFSPPPPSAFWDMHSMWTISDEVAGDTYQVAVSMDPSKQPRTGKVQSPVNKFVFYDEKMTLHATSLQFGVMTRPDTMMPMQELRGQSSKDFPFEVNLRRRRIEANFRVPFIDPRKLGDMKYVSHAPVGQYDRTTRYKFQIPFGHLKVIERIGTEKDNIVLLLTVDSPPQFYRKRDDPKGCHPEGNLVWDEFDTWYRQTDIVYDPKRIANAPIALHKERPVIDLGRWTTYRWVFSLENNEARVYENIKAALKDFNIEIVTINDFYVDQGRNAPLWSMIDPPAVSDATADLTSLNDSRPMVYLPFEVRYQLEVCISREILNEYNISQHFIETLAKLASRDPARARNLLEYVAEQDRRLYKPISIFDKREALEFSSMTDIPHYCALSRKATITPSTIYFSSPTVETTNRVLRHYSRENKEGRFLRVQFTDEKLEGRINACADRARNDELFSRVFRTLYNGIRIGDRHYEFLAFGNSQFRENGAYFFCPTSTLSCNDIRRWMGNFSHINVPAKYAARLGQCFSTTRAINGLAAPDIVKIPDIERNSYCFTDGVGKISPYLAQMIAGELKIRAPAPPSAFQFRLGGCKGILVVSPDAKDKEVHIRRSQQKFTAVYNGLEIIRCSQYSAATLNRQTITILSALGVKDEVFTKLLAEQLTSYQSAMSDNEIALNLLSRYIDDNHMTINIADMIINGFMSAREPFVLSLLHLWRAWSIKLLKEKAKIIIEKGAFVLGCVDETGTLRGFTNPSVDYGKRFKREELPQIFIQVPTKDDMNSYNVIEGICLVGRNPSLHPGDLRVVEAVNVPALHHLRDVVVFPQTGERDIPSMCSGGDLDGDDFFVIWDANLQPPEWNCEPLKYAAPTPLELDRPVEVVDLMRFFVRFMKNDSLPTIAHAHLAQADYLDRGVKDPRCLELAELHSKAVDYVKTGQPAEMPKRLAPRNWPHFMEKRFKPLSQQYHSDKVLGKLYDQVETVDFKPQWQEPFDKRILRAYKLDNAILKLARQIKSKYDVALKRIMAQMDIRTEFEVWSTFVLSKPRVGSDYKLQEEMANISGALKERFRLVCIQAAGSKDFATLGPFVAAMYKVTKEELDIALFECQQTKVSRKTGQTIPKRKMEVGAMPLISFPWLFEKELGRIATGIEAHRRFQRPGFQNANLPSEDIPTAYTKLSEEPLPEEDFIKTENGVVVHRGEVLDLFREDTDEDSDYYDSSDSSDSSADSDEDEDSDEDDNVAADNMTSAPSNTAAQVDAATSSPLIETLDSADNTTANEPQIASSPVAATDIKDKPEQQSDKNTQSVPENADEDLMVFGATPVPSPIKNVVVSSSSSAAAYTPNLPSESSPVAATDIMDKPEQQSNQSYQSVPENADEDLMVFGDTPVPSPIKNVVAPSSSSAAAYTPNPPSEEEQEEDEVDIEEMVEEDMDFVKPGFTSKLSRLL